MDKTTETTIMIFIVVGIIVFDALKTLLSVLEKGIMKDRRKILMKKTNTELRSMLKGVNKISRLNKHQLVEMVMVYC